MSEVYISDAEILDDVQMDQLTSFIIAWTEDVMSHTEQLHTAIEQMVAHEHAGEDGWRRGWEMLKMAYIRGKTPGTSMSN